MEHGSLTLPADDTRTSHGGRRGESSQQTYEALFAEFQPLVRRLMRQYGEDPELRQELPGEIFCRFCALVDAYDPHRGVPLRPYLVRGLTASAYTFARSHWRRQKRETQFDTESDAAESVPSADPTRGWDERIANEKVLKSLPNAIAQLPLRQRQVVIGRYYEGRSFEELAETLRVRPATARSLLRHGINNLRRYLGEQELVAN